MAKKKVRGPRPKGTAEQIRQRGGDALAVLVDFRAQVERRLPAGTIEQLTTDVGSIDGVVPGALVARTEKKAATGGERATAKLTAEHIGSIRDNVKHAYTSNKDVLKGWGVGTKVNPTITKSVVAAGNVIIRRAADRPAEASAAGIVAEDIASLTTQVSSLQGADSAQGGKVRESTDATGARDATLVRVENAVQMIGLRGKQEFLSQPAIRAKFEKLLAPYGKAKKAPKGGGGGGGGGGTT